MKERVPQKQLVLSVLALAGAMVSVQTGSSFAKQLFPEIGAFGASGLRVFLSSLILVSIYRPWRHSFTSGQLRAALAFGLCLGVMNTCFYQAIARIPLGLAVGIEFLGPLTVSLMSSRKPLDLLWAALAATGFVSFLPASGVGDALDPVGVLFALGAAAAWGAYIFAGKRAGESLPGGLALATGMLMANLVSLPPALVESGLSIFQPSLFVAGVLVAVFSSALPYTLEMVALRRLPPYTFGILMSVEPAVAAGVGLLVLGETLTLLQLAGLLAVIGASFGATLQSRVRHPSRKAMDSESVLAPSESLVASENLAAGPDHREGLEGSI